MCTHPATHRRAAPVACNEPPRALSRGAGAIGLRARSDGAASVAIGGWSQSYGVVSTTVGYQSLASGESATALGSGAQAQIYNTAALGANAMAMEDTGVTNLTVLAVYSEP